MKDFKDSDYPSFDIGFICHSLGLGLGLAFFGLGLGFGLELCALLTSLFISTSHQAIDALM